MPRLLAGATVAAASDEILCKMLPYYAMQDDLREDKMELDIFADNEEARFAVTAQRFMDLQPMANFLVCQEGGQVKWCPHMYSRQQCSDLAQTLLEFDLEAAMMGLEQEVEESDPCRVVKPGEFTSLACRKVDRAVDAPVEDTLAVQESHAKVLLMAQEKIVLDKQQMEEQKLKAAEIDPEFMEARLHRLRKEIRLFAKVVKTLTAETTTYAMLRAVSKQLVARYRPKPKRWVTAALEKAMTSRSFGIAAQKAVQRMKVGAENAEVIVATLKKFMAHVGTWIQYGIFYDMWALFGNKVRRARAAGDAEIVSMTSWMDDGLFEHKWAIFGDEVRDGASMMLKWKKSGAKPSKQVGKSPFVLLDSPELTMVSVMFNKLVQ